jgi:hypothetical protein
MMNVNIIDYCIITHDFFRHRSDQEQKRENDNYADHHQVLTVLVLFETKVFNDLFLIR